MFAMRVSGLVLAALAWAVQPVPKADPQKTRELRKEVLEQILLDPCNTTTERVRRLVQDLNAAGVPDSDSNWILRTRAACQNSKDGGLPRFERALMAMTDARRLDPCSYPSGQFDESILDDPNYLQWATRAVYNGGDVMFVRLRNFMTRRSTPEARACLLKVITREIEASR